MKITYSEFENCAQEKTIKSLIKKYSNIVPKAINQLAVQFANNEKSDYCTCYYSKKYSNGIIEIHPLFFCLSKDLQEITIIHEMMHLWTGRLTSHRQKMCELIENEQLRKFIDDAFNCEEELFAETFAFFLHDLLERNK